jgi:hypothetical protein
MLRKSLRLSESSSVLSAVCRAVEAALAPVPELYGLELGVELMENFDRLPEAKRSRAIKNTCAAYRRSTKTLYVNRSTFFSLPSRAQQAVLAHEIAHALAHRDCLPDQRSAYSQLGDFAEEFLADRLTCMWGFFEGLSAERASSYGQRYVKALALWPDESAYCKAMNAWQARWLKGNA